MEKATKQEYITEMRGMFGTVGWRRWLRPRLEEMRTQELLSMVYSDISPEEIRASRRAIQMLDSMMDLENGISRLEEELNAEPAAAADVVDYVQADPSQPQGQPLGANNA